MTIMTQTISRICNFLKGLLIFDFTTGFFFQGRVHSGGLQIPTAAQAQGETPREREIYTILQSDMTATTHIEQDWCCHI